VFEYFICLVNQAKKTTQMRCSHTIYNDRKRRGRNCKRNACDGTDFCKQHNPLNRMDDITCAICLEDIKDPLKTGGCSHIFCKGCLANSVDQTNLLCPYCREQLEICTVSTCIEVTHGKQMADRFNLRMEMEFSRQWRKPWTDKMYRRFAFAFPEYLNCV